MCEILGFVIFAIIVIVVSLLVFFGLGFDEGAFYIMDYFTHKTLAPNNSKLITSDDFIELYNKHKDKLTYDLDFMFIDHILARVGYAEGQSPNDTTPPDLCLFCNRIRFDGFDYRMKSYRDYYRMVEFMKGDKK